MRAWSFAVVASVALATGCVEVVVDTDRDNDGILNIDDSCPDTYGPASNGGCPVQTVNTYGVKPGGGLSFEGVEWGFGVTADGTGAWTISMVGNGDLGEDRFTGSVYVTKGTVGGTSACATCQASGVTTTSSTQIDFDVLISNAGLAGFNFTHNRTSSADPIYLDAYINAGRVGTWRIYFVSSDTNQVVTAPENPVALVSP